ncbi:MAG: hypothetical protein L0Y80_05225 [Ignavibacteriae bacterium]|nr:hypothetical protein [Ignavibacteriota bacterium]
MRRFGEGEDIYLPTGRQVLACINDGSTGRNSRTGRAQQARPATATREHLRFLGILKQ